MNEPRTLRTLRPGDEGTIADVTGEDGVAVRIMEMGLLEGESIRCIGAAPLGDPIEFEVRGCRISLRATEADRVKLA